MDDVIVIESEESENSVIEVEVPRKPTPPLVYVDDEDIMINIKEKNQDCILAKDFIEKDIKFSQMFNNPGSSKNLSNPKHWTSDMIKFYDDDWGDEEDFIVEKLQEKMNKHPSLWEVSRRDKLFLESNFRRSNTKCWNCGQRGHNFSLCPDPPQPAKCYMCGIEGHVQYFCPNSKCLNCGNFSREYVTSCFKCRHQENEKCSRCQLVGHNFINCPDHWRLFHMTTGTTTVKVPEHNIYKSEKDMWCCNCGKKGHYHIRCKKRKNYDRLWDSLPFVISYQTAQNVNNFRNKTNDVPWMNEKIPIKKEEEAEMILRLNPLYKAIRKNKINLKNKLKRLKRLIKNKKKHKRKKNRERFFDGLLI